MEMVIAIYGLIFRYIMQDHEVFDPGWLVMDVDPVDHRCASRLTVGLVTPPHINLALLLWGV